MALLTKEEIKEKLLAGDPMVELRKSLNTKSVVWQNYHLVYVDNIKMSWAYCLRCHELVTYTACTGTGGLHRHRCNKQVSRESIECKSTRKAIKMELNESNHGAKKVKLEVQSNENKEDNKRRSSDALKEEVMPMNFLENIYQEDNLCVEGYLTPDISAKTRQNLIALTKVELKEKIIAGDPNIELKHPKGTKTQVWENFRMVYVDNKKQDWAYCIKCSEMICYSGRTGTGGLHRHRCVKQAANSMVNDSSVEYSVVKKETLTKEALNEMSRRQLLFVAKDLLSFSVLEGEGFLALAQTLIDIGAQYGKQNVKQLLKSRKTISHILIPAECEKAKESIQTELFDQFLAFSIDIWTDEYTQRSFLTLSAHHITIDFKLSVNVLANREISSNSGILQMVIEILSEFNLEQRLYSGVFITENEPGIKAAFKSYKRLSCACQNLNLVMNDVLESGNILDLTVLIEACKALVSYFEYTELNNRLSIPLEQYIDRGWHSIFNMLNSILKVFPEIQNILVEKNSMARLANIDYNFLIKLVEFLQPFKECSERLGLETEPVIQEYVLWHQKLVNLCVVDTLDSDVIRIVKMALEESLMNRFEPNNIHYVALFLNPPFKDLNCLPVEKRELVVASVRAMLTQIDDNTKRKGNKDSINSYTDRSSSRFSEFFDSSFSASNGNEVNKQIASYMNKEITFVEPILTFWKKNESLYLLQELARQILCVPASSNNTERVFSPSSQILVQRRSHLLNKNLNEIIFLNKSMK